MTTCWHKLGLVLGFSLIALSGSGCGGRSDDGSEGGAGQGGNVSGKGGAAPGSGGATGKGGTSSGTGGTGGGVSGSGGKMSASGGSGQGGGCDYAGKHYAVGDSFPASDGCNSCYCAANNVVSCTLKACNACVDLQTRATKAVELAKACNPALSVEQCTLSVTNGFACGCPTFVNPKNTMALEELKRVQAEYMQSMCVSNVICGPCAPPGHGYCSPNGRCEDDAGPARRSCKVAGVVYPDGYDGIKDPGSCNTCSCNDGQLACTEIGCGSTCPAGTAFGMQCAECGPTDACVLPEYDCFPTCTDKCPNSNQFCLNGLCKSGICG
ncbi:MAG: hypothetical protein ACOY0T_38470 [Myxococcota bacterium]